ncbi:MAG: GAF domain-containing protein [Deltaproteobacteria bacterium]|nr:GAF domain-containing protein [Deltaproteobacteria bacterium]MDL1961609.1 GAF domain-containing protein [Deltaproteobacteria bacterium]
MESERSALARKIQELTVLYEISQLLVSVPDPKEALGPVLDILHSKMGVNRGTITLLDPVTQELGIKAAHGLTDRERRRGHYQIGEGITGKVVETGEPVIVPHIGKEPLFLNRTKARGDIQKSNISFICVPIKIGSFTYGTLSADRLFSEEISFEEDLRLLTIIASNVAQAIKISRMMEEEKDRLWHENVIFPIYLPPLREKKTDILLLADYFLEKYKKKYKKDAKRISTPAIDMLMRYHWPGNVRELENCMERTVLLCNNQVVHSYNLPPSLQTAESSETVPSGSLSSAMAVFEKEYITDALKNARGNIAKAARLLDTSERILGLRVKKYGIQSKQFR